MISKDGEAATEIKILVDASGCKIERIRLTLPKDRGRWMEIGL
jgi:hypothetical protein